MMCLFIVVFIICEMIINAYNTVIHWHQVDMQQLLDEQMRRKLSKLEMGSSAARHHHNANNNNNNSDSDSSCGGKSSPRKNSRLFAILTTLKR